MNPTEIGPAARHTLYFEAARGDRRAAIGAIQVGRAGAEIEALLALACGGYFLAGRALSLVDRITAAAERIGAEDLSRRLALRLPNDELGRLPRVFDGMIDRLDQAFQRPDGPRRPLDHSLTAAARAGSGDEPRTYVGRGRERNAMLAPLAGGECTGGRRTIPLDRTWRSGTVACCGSGGNHD